MPMLGAAADRHSLEVAELGFAGFSRGPSLAKGIACPGALASAPFKEAACRASTSQSNNYERNSRLFLRVGPGPFTVIITVRRTIYELLLKQIV